MICTTKPVIVFPACPACSCQTTTYSSLPRSFSELLPAVSIHPARPDALAELERCAAAGAVLLKLLPCVQAVDCNRKQYKPFWQRLAELNLPLLAHTGGEFSLPTHRRDLQSVESLRFTARVRSHCHRGPLRNARLALGPGLFRPIRRNAKIFSKSLRGYFRFVASHSLENARPSSGRSAPNPLRQRLSRRDHGFLVPACRVDFEC